MAIILIFAIVVPSSPYAAALHTDIIGWLEPILL